MNLKNLKHCNDCDLCKLRTNVVLGCGNKKSNLIFVGEAPGKNEDAEGKPFVGRAGKILDKMLKLAEISRESIYITNIVKCRPPENRNPNNKEIFCCSKWLKHEIQDLKPKYVITLGNYAARFFLKDNSAQISKVHGIKQNVDFEWYDKGSLFIYPVYHPAALIYDRHKMKQAESFFIKLKEIKNFS